jgi:hypothetical protein
MDLNDNQFLIVRTDSLNNVIFELIENPRIVTDCFGMSERSYGANTRSVRYMCTSIEIESFRNFRAVVAALLDQLVDRLDPLNDSIIE